MTNTNIKTPTKILIAGEGGQGIQTIAKILVDVARACWYNVSYIPHYGVEMRMGISFAFVQIAKNKEIGYPKFSKADILAVLTKRDLVIPKSFVGKNTTIINCIDLSKEPAKHKLPNKTFNTMCLGIITKALKDQGINLSISHTKETITKYLKNKPGLADNLSAFGLGLKLDKKMYDKSLDKVSSREFKPMIDEDNKKQIVRFPNLCKSCGLCLIKCPAQAISWSIDETNFISRPMPKVNPEKCIACKTCERICPDSAIKIVKK